MAISGMGTKEANEERKVIPVVEKTRPIVVKSATVVDRDTAISKMLDSVDGERLKGTYYNQYVTKDDEQRKLDTGEANNEKNYRKIVDAILTVTTPLETSKMTDLEFSAISPIGLRPMIGDMFVFRVISGELGMFSVTNIETRSYNLEETFILTFKIDTLDSISPERIKNLDSRVIETLHYVENEILEDRNPYLNIERYNIYERVKLAIDRIAEDYIEKYTDKNGHLTVCIGGVITLDPYITTFFRDIIPEGIDITNIYFPKNKLDTEVNIDEYGNTILSALINIKKRYKTNKIYVRRNKLNGTGREILITRYPSTINQILTVIPGSPFSFVKDKYSTSEEYDDNTYLPFPKLQAMAKRVVSGESIFEEEISYILETYEELPYINGYWMLPMMLFFLTEFKRHMYKEQT